MWILATWVDDRSKRKTEVRKITCSGAEAVFLKV